MPQRLDQILIIDVECTCWKNRIVPRGQKQEIIQIGLCLFDPQSCLLHGKRSIIVRPRYSAVSKFCTELTGITPEEAARGISFSLACHILKNEYLAEHRVWASWGDFDRKRFRKQCGWEGIEYPFGDSHENIRNLFSLLLGLSEKLEIPDALKMLGMEFSGRLHRGDDDAWNIGRILSDLCTMTRILQKFSSSTDAYL
ncbi:MAG: 3'-5' exonuclease [bacterium]|nr:3'-5' exonuclease [bacterium]